jgi:hypothetical protein
MAEPKSSLSAFRINAHSVKTSRDASFSINSLAADSECPLDSDDGVRLACVRSAGILVCRIEAA